MKKDPPKIYWLLILTQLFFWVFCYYFMKNFS